MLSRMFVLAVLGGCVAAPRQSQFRQQLNVDSYSSICGKAPANCAAAMGQDVGPAAVAGAVGVYLSSRDSPRAIDRLLQEKIDRAMKECADLARSEVLLRRGFKESSPTKQDCDEVIGRNGRGEPITQAMQMGIEMHEVAEQCAEKRLNALRPGGFRIEQRYRYDPETGVVTPVERGTTDLSGTLVPDVVIHEPGNPQYALDIYDFKFPCVNTDRFIDWRAYPQEHPHFRGNQGAVYKRYFRLKEIPARVQPRIGIKREL